MPLPGPASYRNLLALCLLLSTVALFYTHFSVRVHYIHRPNMPSLCPLPADRTQAKLAYATMVSSADYKIGAFVLMESVRANGDLDTPFLVLHPARVTFSNADKELLLSLNAITRTIQPLTGPAENLAMERFSHNFQQLRLWEQTDFDVVIFMDADSLVLKNIHHLFNTVMMDQFPFASAADNLAAQLTKLSGLRAEDEVSSFILNAGFEILRPCNYTFADLMYLLASDEVRDLQIRYTQWIWEYYWGNYMLVLPYTIGGSAYKALDAVPLSHRYHIHFYGGDKPWTLFSLADLNPECNNAHPSVRMWLEYRALFLKRAASLNIYF